MILKQFNKPLPLLALIAALYPVLMLFLVLVTASIARLYLGHWPSYNNPDPGTIAWGFPHLAIQLCLIALPVSPFLALALGFGSSTSWRGQLMWVITVTLAVSWVLYFTYLKFDPGGFIDWILD